MKTIESQAPRSITPRDLQRSLAAGSRAQLIDVRTPGEFAAGHLPGAHLIPLDRLNPAEFQGASGECGPIYVLCESGRRARKAIAKLENAGVCNCILVEGGTQAWLECGLPIERSSHGGLPLMRQVQIVVGSLTAAGAVLALAVNPYFAVIPLVLGCGLFFAGLTGMCGLALFLTKMPWNRGRTCCQGCAGGDPS